MPQQPYGYGGRVLSRGAQGHPSSAPSANNIADLLKPSARLPVYFAGNERSAPRPELFDAEARAVAEKIASFPASQLRRFYAAVMALRQQLERDKKIPDDLVRARMAQLKAQAAYAYKRGKNYPDAFLRFFTDNAAAVLGRDDFLRGFQPHFEAVVAYHKALESKGEERR